MYSNIVWEELKVLHCMRVLNDEDYDAAIQIELEKDEDKKNENL